MADETPPFFEHLRGLFAVTLLQIGRRTGPLRSLLVVLGPFLAKKEMPLYFEASALELRLRL